MKPEFLENYRSEHEDTLDARTYDFDWADPESRLGEAEEQLEDRDFAAHGSALQSIIEWIIEGADFTKLDADAHVGRRAIALFWTLNPDYFEGVSLTALANRLGLHKAIVSAQAAEARRKFWIKNRGQAHGWNFGKAEPKPMQTRKGSIGTGRHIAAQGAALPVQPNERGRR